MKESLIKPPSDDVKTSKNYNYEFDDKIDKKQFLGFLIHQLISLVEEGQDFNVVVSLKESQRSIVDPYLQTK